MEFLLFNEVLKNLIFFQLPINKIGFITPILSKFQILNCGQFIAKDMNLWSTLLNVRFEKLTFSDFWGPQKRSNFWILDL